MIELSSFQFEMMSRYWGSTGFKFMYVLDGVPSNSFRGTPTTSPTLSTTIDHDTLIKFSWGSEEIWVQGSPDKIKELAEWSI